MNDRSVGSGASTIDLVAAPEAVGLDDVVKRYPGGVLALNRVTLSIEKNEFVAISGPSGCGKSTLLHLIAALDKPTSGTVRVMGRDLDKVRDISRYRREEVGLIFQLHNLLPRISVLANVELAMYGTHRGSKARRIRALDLLEQVDLADRDQRLPTQLSGGERQRVAIARALANDPSLLLADEPTGNLDAEAAENVMNLFSRVRAGGMTILLVTHDERLAQRADRIVKMRGGQLVSTGAGE